MSASYAPGDPRAALAKGTLAALPPRRVLRGCGYGAFTEIPPQMVEPDGARTWLIRGAHTIVAISEVHQGTVLSRANNADEYIVLLDVDGLATFSAGNVDTVEAGPGSVTIVPPGQSSIICHRVGYVVRCFTTRAEDILSLALNNENYQDFVPECQPLVNWPDPPGGFRLRNYDILNMERVTFGHIIRSTNLMVSLPERGAKRRDPHKLSPHHHDDFEQVSVGLSGTWLHHLRVPWTPDMTTWRDDEHVTFASPSALVIPAGLIHTSQDVGQENGWIIDVFSPPRADFSRQAGWVLNEADYPVAPDRSA
jgi:mannose-6-phosphate isomerase-like protein (cupin superfamily)